jgi:hypothetical protein
MSLTSGEGFSADGFKIEADIIRASGFGKPMARQLIHELARVSGAALQLRIDA